MRFFLMMMAALCAVWTLLAETVLLECEAFEERGGWVNDTQFMDQMGSPYLLAHGLGCPVADAKTTFVVRETATYDVWVRTKNWTSPWHPDVGAGTFNLIVNGQKLPNLLGAQGKGEWLWVKADSVKLERNKVNTLALHDRDGFDGRCDAVVFTTAAMGGRELEALRTERKDNKRTTTSADLVVVGGGIGGICTAVSAARLGLKVALVHDRPVLGGNNSSEVRVHLGAWQNLPPYPRLGDVLAEFGPTRFGNAEDAANYEDDRKLAIVKREKNIELFLNTRVEEVEEVEEVEKRICAVIGQDVVTGARTRFEARWFADCTGDGAVGYLAGADWRMGREAKDETGEPWAPEKPDMLTMGASVQWRARECVECREKSVECREKSVECREKSVECREERGECKFPLRDWMIRFDDTNGRAELKGDWDWETGFGRDQIMDAERIRDYGLLVAYSNWAYAKNVASNRAEFADKELEWVAYVAGRRESRRLIGDFVLSQTHLRNREAQPDGTCAATWTIDLHFPKPAEETKFGGEPFVATSRNELIWPYAIPYRCFYSRNVPNLFMAGRCISVTHAALGAVRLMRTIGMMGEVVGMAASVCKRHGCDPRDVYEKHFDELKQLMTKGVGDGKPHPSQAYNCQESLDPAIREKYFEGTRGRLMTAPSGN